MKAIILAAGMGTRLRELTVNKPKSLVQINNKPFIHYQIEYLKEVGIDDIIVVTGYLSEQFDYLKDKYGVKLVYNDKYSIWNNFYSLYCVKDFFEDAYLIDADNYLSKNIFDPSIKDSTYFSILRDNCINEYFIYTDDNNKINKITVENGYGNIVAGVSFWNKETSSKMIEIMDEIYSKGEHSNIYWDDIVRLNLDKLDVYEKKLGIDDIFEVDTMEDYNELNRRLKKL